MTKFDDEPQRMQCMEIWGGNCSIDKNFRAPGMDIYVHSIPYGDSQSGGDLYYLTSCASGRISRFLLADVCGHGEAVSEVAVGLRDLLRDNVNTIKQERFVEQMNARFGQLGQDESFATAVVATFFEPTNSLSINVAGHPYPIFYRASQQTWFHLDPAERQQGPENMPLGVLKETAYPGRRIEAEQGDMFLLYTDAFIECVDSSGQLLGINGLVQLLNDRPDLPVDQVIEYICHRIVELDNDNLKTDDASIILGAVTRTKVRLQDNLLSPFRLAKKVRDRTKIVTG